MNFTIKQLTVSTQIFLISITENFFNYLKWKTSFSFRYFDTNIKTMNDDSISNY